MDDKRAALADYLDERVDITGMFDRFSLQVTGIKQWRTALLQDVYAEVEGKQIDLGHVWVQHADPLKQHDLAYGDRIKCNCRVTAYKKHLRVPNEDGLMVVEKYSLSWPTEVEVISQASRPSEPSATSTLAASEPQQEELPSPISLLVELKQLAAKAGGWSNLRQLIDLLGS